MRTWNNHFIKMTLKKRKGNYKALFKIESVEERTKPVLVEYLPPVMSRLMSDFNTIIKKQRKKGACYAIVKHI